LLLVLLALAVTGLVLLSEISSSSQNFARLYPFVLSANVIAAVLLMMLIGANLVRLYRDYHDDVPGARLESRLAGTFVVLVIVPLAVVYLYSVRFLNEGIDSWFDVDVEQGLTDALDLSRRALDVQMRNNLAETRHLADSLYRVRDAEVYTYLPQLRLDANAEELSVFAGGSRVVATSAANPAGNLPMLPTEELILNLRRNSYFVTLEPQSGDNFVVRAAVLLPGRSGRDSRILQAIFPLDKELGELAGSVQGAVRQYSELTFLREPLKSSFVLTLSIVVLVTFLIAVYSAFFFARRLSAPVQNLIAGTRSVAQGDLDTRLPSGESDEIGILVDSFNDMIEQLDAARLDARRNEAQVENERASVEAILARLSSGVIALEKNLTIRTANQSAEQLLSVDLRGYEGFSIESLATRSRGLKQLVRVLKKHQEQGEIEWREQVKLRLEGGNKVLVCACTALPGSYRSRVGCVLVFDDISNLLQAQREAAWGEVARRLAHEIKNPLTPIQLSAERMRRKLLGRIDAESGELLDRATHTIVEQVEAMRDMVNAFSEYARAPEINRTNLDLNHLITQVADLYPSQRKLPSVRLKLAAGLPQVRVDAVRMRQVMHNLIRNALEAMEGQEDAVVVVETELLHRPRGRRVRIGVRDNGPGLPEEDLEKIFEPYVTTKSKGTGLGLAIVKKLVEEHRGEVNLDSQLGVGTVVEIILPADEAEEDAHDNTPRRQSA